MQHTVVEPEETFRGRIHGHEIQHNKALNTQCTMYRYPSMSWQREAGVNVERHIDAMSARHAPTPSVRQETNVRPNMLGTRKCATNGRETSPSTRFTNKHMVSFPRPHLSRKVFPQPTRETRTCDAWETLHAAVAAPAPSPNAFAVEKHASAAAATQIRLYILPRRPSQDAYDERALLACDSGTRV